MRKELHLKFGFPKKRMGSQDTIYLNFGPFVQIANKVVLTLDYIPSKIHFFSIKGLNAATGNT